MKRYNAKHAALALIMVLTLGASSWAQSLTDKLSEDDTYYKNYGRDTYARLKIEKDVVGRYDMFGEHITDGVQIYNFYNQAYSANNERDGIKDSMLYSASTEYSKTDFYKNFSNLVITNDAVGGFKTSFLIGDQISTRFTPLTFSKQNFRGVRWDIWMSQLQLTTLFSRTSPGELAMKDVDNMATVRYPLDASVFDYSYYSSSGFRGTQEFSNKSPYGDYDLLVALHAEHNIANAVDVGVSYVNHHKSNVEKGEKWLQGDVADGWMPDAVHFEFFDATPFDTTDAGVYVDDIVMYINGDEVEAQPLTSSIFRRTFVGDETGILFPRNIPINKPQSGQIPILVEFQIDPRNWQFAHRLDANNMHTRLFSKKEIKHISFRYKIAGNYQVFVSTDRQIPLAIQGTVNPQTGEVAYYNSQKSIGDIYDAKLKIGEYQPVTTGTISEIVNRGKRFSTTYFGDFVAQSPRLISVSKDAFIDICSQTNIATKMPLNEQSAQLYNYKWLSYEYRINVSSITYGVNFKGELAGIKFSGELALNQNESKLPGSDESRATANRFSGNLKAERELTKELSLSGEGYYIAPDWQTSLNNLQASPYFNKTNYKDPMGYPYYSGIPDYLSYPYPLSNGYTTIDDNDDNDPFVENDRRHYPDDDNPDNKKNFYLDGTRKTTLARSIGLPTGMTINYDDPDGVVSSKNDKNKNGTPDYREDFLLFSSDPPVFDLGTDLNNNGIPDYEDDDMLPDFGHAVGYTLTSNGIKMQGVQGGSLNMHITPVDKVALDVGAIFDDVVDHDFLYGVKEDEQGFQDNFARFQGKSLVGYVTGKYQIRQRSQGLLIDLGGELRAIKDAFPNDVIVSKLLGDSTYVYYYKTDPLNFRQAATGSLTATVEYNNIPQFEYQIRAKLGVEKRFQIENEQFFNVYTLRDPVSDDISYEPVWEPYQAALITDLHFVNKLSYTINFKNEFEGALAPLNLVNNLQIIPQYKLAFSMRKALDGPNTNDPRDYKSDLLRDKNGDGKIDGVYDDVGNNLDTVRAARLKFAAYELDNESYLLNVPILRFNYKIAEKTQLQVGMQWKKYFDVITPTQSYMDASTLVQLVTRSQYKGYTVTLFLGCKVNSRVMDANVEDYTLQQGSRYNTNWYEFFVKLYSGI